jgi:hypothetical protein
MNAGTPPEKVTTNIPTQEDPRWVAADIEAAKKRAMIDIPELRRVANLDALAEVPIPPHGSVNMPISWPQLIGGWLSDLPFFLMAALGVVATWLQSSAPVTTRGAVTVAILAILAGLTAVQRATGTDGLSLRLRSMGQLKSGK